MKVCIFTHTFPRFPGDTSAPFMEELASALSQTKNDIFVLTPYDSRIDVKVRRPFKLVTYRYILPDSLHILGYSRTLQGDRSMSLGSYLLSPLLFIFSFFALLNLVKREKIDIICAHWIIPNGFIAALVSEVSGVPFTVTIPGSDIYMGGKNFLFRMMVGFAARSAAYVLSDSNHYLAQLRDLGFNPAKTSIVRYGVNTRKFKPTGKDKIILRKFGLKTEPIILAVGRMVAKKGFIYLIEAMLQVSKKIPRAKLVMVGDGDERENLEKRVRELKIEKSIIFAGMIPYDQLSKYYNLADVFVMPSIRDESGNIDASPVAMMEAMVCGTPVVATRFSGSKDLIDEGRTGFLVKEKDSNLIAQALVTLLKGKLSKSTRSVVREIAERNFSSLSVSRRYVRLFELALSSK